MSFNEHPIEWDDQKISRLWDYYSRTPPYSEVYFSKVFGDRLIERSGLPLEQPLKVLDFGCGPGFIWDHLLALNARWHYEAVDFSPASVAQLSQKARGHSQFHGAHHLVSLPAPVPSGHYDVVLLFEVVEHLKDEYLDSTFAEAQRVLKSGGVLVVSTPNQEDLNRSTKLCPECGAIFHEWQHVRSWSIAGLSARLEKYGFKLCKVETLDFAARGLVRGTIGKFRKWLGRPSATPHMIAVFQKV